MEDVSHSSAIEPRSGLPFADIRVQVDRILAHREFLATPRLHDLLRFVVEETLAGRTSQTRGSVIAQRVFDRGEDFDAARDPIVRIEAGRLRRALERYYLVAGTRDPIRIDIPKGRYVPSFRRQPSSRTRASDSGIPQEWTSPPPEGPAVAIMPFANLTGSAGQIEFLDGLADELATEFDRYEEIVSVPCQRPFPEEPYNLPPADLGKEVGARFLLQGSVRQAPQSTKIGAHLLDSMTGKQIWADSYEIDLSEMDAITAQEDAACRVAAAIAGEYGTIANHLWKESRSKPSSELTTFDAMLRYHRYMLVMTPSAFEEACAALQEAKERNPEHGPTWSALANLHAHAYEFDQPGMEDPLLVANEYARKGAALAPNSQLARTVLSYVHLLKDDDTLFLVEAEAALSLNPNSPNYAGTIGYLLVASGEYERGSRLLRRAIALNPHHPKWFHHGLFVAAFAQGDYENAFMENEMVGHPVAFWDLALRAAVLGKLGRVTAAQTALADLLELEPDFELRVRDTMSRTLKPQDVGEHFLDGLRKAGLRVE